jgi:hypothetical protein
MLLHAAMTLELSTLSHGLPCNRDVLLHSVDVAHSSPLQYLLPPCCAGPALLAPPCPHPLPPCLPCPGQARSIEAMSDKSVPEYAPFASTLALRMAGLLKSELRGHIREKWAQGVQGAGVKSALLCCTAQCLCTSRTLYAHVPHTACLLPALPRLPPPLLLLGLPSCRRRVPREGWAVAAGC